MCLWQISYAYCICIYMYKSMSSQVVLVVKNLPVNAGDTRDSGSSLGWKDPLKEEMVTHSSILAWRIPWTEEPGGLQFMGSQRIWHDWVHIHTYADSDRTRNPEFYLLPSITVMWEGSLSHDLPGLLEAELSMTACVCVVLWTVSEERGLWSRQNSVFTPQLASCMGASWTAR